MASSPLSKSMRRFNILEPAMHLRMNHNSILRTLPFSRTFQPFTFTNQDKMIKHTSRRLFNCSHLPLSPQTPSTNTHTISSTQDNASVADPVSMRRPRVPAAGHHERLAAAGPAHLLRDSGCTGGDRDPHRELTYTRGV